MCVKNGAHFDYNADIGMLSIRGYKGLFVVNKSPELFVYVDVNCIHSINGGIEKLSEFFGDECERVFV